MASLAEFIENHPARSEGCWLCGRAERSEIEENVRPILKAGKHPPWQAIANWMVEAGAPAEEPTPSRLAYHFARGHHNNG